MNSYGRYKRGLRILEQGVDPIGLRDMELAKQTLASLHSATIGAGSNTWREARRRYDAAERRYAHLRLRMP